MSSSHEEVDVASEHTDEMSECSGFWGRTAAGDDGHDVTMAIDCNGVSLQTNQGKVNLRDAPDNCNIPTGILWKMIIDMYQFSIYLSWGSACGDTPIGMVTYGIYHCKNCIHINLIRK